MTKKDIEKILSLSRKTKSAAEKATGKKFTDEVWESFISLRTTYGNNISEWPQHFLKIIDVPPIQNTKADGDAAIGLGNVQSDSTPSRKKPVKFAEITDEDEQFIRMVHAMEATARVKCNLMHERFGIGDRTSDWWYNKLGLTNKRIDDIDYIKAAKSRVFSGKRIHFYSAAQNATKVHEAGFKSMMTYAKHLDADVHIINYRYRNPTSVFTDLPHEWWDPTIVPFLDETRHYVAENLIVCSDIKIQPTKSRPLEGLQAITDGATAIISHPRQHMVCSAVLEHDHKQVLWSTGAITVENYTDTLTGKKGESFHQLGFVIVEIDGDGSGDSHHIRHVSICDDGSFQDLFFVVDGGEVRTDGKITTCRFGDIHAEDHDINKIEASLEMCSILSPDYVILDDVFNGHSGYLNYHERNNKVLIHHNMKAGRFSIQTEVEKMVELVKHICDEVPDAEVVVVRSNHDERLDKYVRSSDWRDDPFNADFFTHCLGILLANTELVGLVPYFLESALGDRVKCLSLDDSFKPDGSQHAAHGHEGKNGSKGSLSQFASFSAKMTTNHSHTPGRIDGALSAGTSTHLRLQYNTGASSWRWGDVIGYPNGKRANILFNSKYRYTTLKHPIYG